MKNHSNVCKPPTKTVVVVARLGTFLEINSSILGKYRSINIIYPV